ncbi:MAG: hypothetical protein ACLFVP_08410 [Candidatus Bathyarchaeia archaeon]
MKIPVSGLRRLRCRVFYVLTLSDSLPDDILTSIFVMPLMEKSRDISDAVKPKVSLAYIGNSVEKTGIVIEIAILA